MDEPLTLRLILPQDAPAAAALVRRGLLEINRRDYPPEALAVWAAYYTPAEILRIAAAGRFYLAFRGETAVGTGAVAPEAENACMLRTVFVLPEELGRGVGRRMVETLERDPKFRRCDPILAHSSKTARGFYEALGYRHCGGTPHLVDDDYYPMEKRR